MSAGVESESLEADSVDGIRLQNLEAAEKNVVQKLVLSNQCRNRMDVIGLSVVMVIVGGLLIVPIIFYHLPVDANEANINISVTSGPNTTANGGCLSVSFPYPTAGGVCETELDFILFSMECDSGGATLVLRDEESTAKQLIDSLSFLNPSPECEEEVVPFLCLFLFGLCDSSGVSLQPTSGQCEHLRDGVCSTEWSTALSFGVDLPDCNSFPTEQASCPDQSGSGTDQSGSGTDQSGSGTDQSGSGSGLTSQNITASSTARPTTGSPALLPCREDFFREEGSDSCVPSCATWHGYSQAEVIITDVVILLSMVIGFIAGVVVLVISFISFKRMFSFPSVFVVCLTIDTTIIAFFVIISYFDKASLYCATPNLLESLFEVTPFCVITGMVFLYVLLQIAIWWLFHTTSIFWKISFPFHARRYQTERKLKHIYIVCIIVGILIPLVPIIASMADFAVRVKSDPLLLSRGVTFWSGGLGYGVIRFPPILCTATNKDVVYYGVVLPINIIMIIGILQLILIFWRIHKQYGLFKQKGKPRVGTPERKILCMLCYYVMVSVFALTSFTLATRNSGHFISLVVDYFACETRGHDAENPCDRNTFRQLANPEVTSLAFVLLGLFPAVNLVYALNVKELKEKSKTSRSTIRRSRLLSISIRSTSL